MDQLINVPDYADFDADWDGKVDLVAGGTDQDFSGYTGVIRVSGGQCYANATLDHVREGVTYGRVLNTHITGGKPIKLAESGGKDLTVVLGAANRVLNLGANFTACASNAGELDFTGASKKLDVEDDAVVDQDYSSDASPEFAGLNMTGYEDLSSIADPGAPGAGITRLFAVGHHIISICEDDYWHDLSAGARGVSSGIHTETIVSDQGGLNIQWGAGEVFDAWITGGDQMVDIPAETSNQTLAASSFNIVYYDQTAGGIAYSSNVADVKWNEGDFPVAYVNTSHNAILLITQAPVGSKSSHEAKHTLAHAIDIVVHDGLIISEHSGGGAFDVDLSPGVFSHHGNDTHDVNAIIDSTVTNIIRWYHNAADTWESDTNSQIDKDNWDDDDDGITIKTNNDAKWYRSTFYTDGTNIHWVYPQVEYDNLHAALVALDPTPPPLLEHLPKCTVVIFRGDATNLPAAGSAQWIDVRPMIGTVGPTAITDHGNLSGLSDDDHSIYPLLLGRTGGQTIIGSDTTAEDLTLKDNSIDNNTITITQAISAYTHSNAASGNPHSVTPTELSLVIGSDVQAHDVELDSLAGLTYVAASFVKMTGANTFALRTIGDTADDLQGTIDHNLTANYDANKHVDHTGVSITAGKGLSGGGTIASTRDLALDLAEMTGNVIWNDGSSDASITWTFALSGANDPVWTIGPNSMDLTTGVLKQGGTNVLLVGDAPTAHTHDGDTLQLDGVNSNGGVFSFTTTGAVTFNQAVNTSGPLIVQSPTGASALVKILSTDLNDANSDAGIELYENVNLRFKLYQDGSENKVRMDVTSKSDAIVIDSDGKVGFSDNAPAEIVDVGGNINVTGAYKVDDTQVVKEQQVHIVDAPGDTAANNATTINQILTMLETHGLIAAA